MKKSKTTASEEQRREEKCMRCGLTEQEMDAAILLIQLSTDSSADSSADSSNSSYSSSVSYHPVETAARSELEEKKKEIIDDRVMEKNPLENFRSNKVRKFRSILDLYQSTSPLKTNSNLHGDRVTTGKRVTSDQTRISDAGSVIMEMRDDDQEDEMETTRMTTDDEEEKREVYKSPVLAMVLSKKLENIPNVRKRKFLDFLPT